MTDLRQRTAAETRLRRLEGGTDAALLAATRTDPEAFVEFYDRYERAVVGYFLGRVHSAETAAELTAEVFASILAAADRYEERGETAAGWVFTIARNALGKSVRKGIVDAAVRRRLGADRLEISEDTLVQLQRADGDRWVEDLLSSLPEPERAAVRLRVLDERPYPEIALRLETSETAIRKRVSRGLSRLRERVERNR